MTAKDKTLSFIITLILDSVQIIICYSLKSVSTQNGEKVRNSSEMFKVEMGYHKGLAISPLLIYSFSKANYFSLTSFCC